VYQRENREVENRRRKACRREPARQRVPRPEPGNEGGNTSSYSQLSNLNPQLLVPYPIEYKRGKRKKWDNDDVQLCAQALCLEEMLGVAVPRGAIFHIKSKRRREVAFTDKLRAKTEAAAARLHELIAAGITPPAVLKPQCDGCSLRGICLPGLAASSAGDYCRRLLEVLE